MTTETKKRFKTEVVCKICGKHWLWGLANLNKDFICPDCEKKEIVKDDDEEEKEYPNDFDYDSWKEEQLV